MSDFEPVGSARFSEFFLQNRLKPALRTGRLEPALRADSQGASAEQVLSEQTLLQPHHLRGAAGSILLHLLKSDRPQTKKEIAQATRYSDKPVKRAVDRLAGLGFLEENGRGCWALTPGSVKRLFTLSKKAQTRQARMASDPGSRGPDRQWAIAERDRLPDLLKRIGIKPPKYDRLRTRKDLQEEPERVLGAWWEILTEEGLEKRLGALINRLERNYRPPEAYLILAQAWPYVSLEDRWEMRDMRWHKCSAYQLEEEFRNLYPELTAAEYQVYLDVCAAGHEEEFDDWLPFAAPGATLTGS